MLTIYIFGYIVMFLTLLAIQCVEVDNNESFLFNLIFSALFAVVWPVLLPVLLLLRIAR